MSQLSDCLTPVLVKQEPATWSVYTELDDYRYVGMSNDAENIIVEVYDTRSPAIRLLGTVALHRLDESAPWENIEALESYLTIDK